MCFHCYLVPFPEVSAKNIYYCGQNPGERHSFYGKRNYKYHMPLKMQFIRDYAKLTLYLIRFEFNQRKN